MTTTPAGTPAEADDVAVVQKARVVYDDGHAEEYDVSRPSVFLAASKLESANDTEYGFNLVWCAAGKPHGTLELWIDTVKSLTVADAPADPPTGGTPDA